MSFGELKDTRTKTTQHEHRLPSRVVPAIRGPGVHRGPFCWDVVMVASQRRRAGCQGQGRWSVGERGLGGWLEAESEPVTPHLLPLSLKERTLGPQLHSLPVACDAGPPHWALAPQTHYSLKPLCHILVAGAVSLASEKQALSSLEGTMCFEGIGKSRPSSVTAQESCPGAGEHRGVPATASPPVNEGV